MQLTRIRFLLFLISILTLSSCIPEKKSVFISTGLDFGKDPLNTVTGNYVELDYDVIDTIIHQFGNNYEIKKTDFWEFYTWEKIRVSAIDRKPIKIKVSRHITDLHFYKEKKPNRTEMISISITKNNSDYLHPLRFRYRYKVKMFLIKIVDDN